MARTFTQLKKAMTTEQLNNFCKTIAESYAQSYTCFSRKYYCEQYNITISCYEKVKDYAIVNNLVSDKIVNLMRDKAIANQQYHMSQAGASSWRKFDILMVEREENKRKTETRKCAIEFAYNPNIPKRTLAAMHGMTIKDFEKMLVIAIEENEVEDAVVDLMEERSIKNSDSTNHNKITQFFAGLREKREKNKKEITLN